MNLKYLSRMRKTALDVFDYATALDSPEGDTTVVADFTFDAEQLQLLY